MARLIAIMLAVAALVYLAVVGAHWFGPRMEQDISNRVTAALANKGLLFADVDVRGRDVVLSGTATSENERDAALSTVARVFGVASVSNSIVLVTETTPLTRKQMARMKDYQLTMDKSGDQITLSGSVPDEATAAVLNRIAGLHYGPEHVSSTLVVEGGAPAGWRSAAGSILMHMANLEDSHVVLNGTEIMMEGSALTEDFKDQVQTDITASLPTLYKMGTSITVVQAQPEAAEEVAGNDVSETEVDDENLPVAQVQAATPTENMPTAPAPTAEEEQASNPVIEPAAGGCALATVSHHVVHFGFDKTDLAKSQLPIVGQVAGIIHECEKGDVTIKGYTDATGSKLYNKWLSEQRAQATQRALIREGVDAARLHAIGLGEKDPVKSNATREGRAANRRVEFMEGLYKAVQATVEKAVQAVTPRHHKAKVHKPVTMPKPMPKPAMAPTKTMHQSGMDKAAPMPVTVMPALDKSKVDNEIFWNSMEKWMSSTAAQSTPAEGK